MQVRVQEEPFVAASLFELSQIDMFQTCNFVKNLLEIQGLCYLRISSSFVQHMEKFQNCFQKLETKKKQKEASYVEEKA